MPRGNPNWGKEQQQSATPCLTEFEKKCVELSLSPDQYVRSEELRVWSAAHRHTRYVPEALLKAWGFAAESSR